MSYTRTDLITSVKDDLKDPSFSDNRIGRYLNYGQNTIFNTHMFRFCEETNEDSLSQGESAIDLPSNHQATIGGVLYDSVTKSLFKLDNESYMGHRDFFAEYPEISFITQGMPTKWTEYGNELFFNAPMDKSYDFRQRYFRAPQAMSKELSVPDLPESFRELLEQYALYRSEKYRGNHDIAATYKQDFEDGLENMVLRYAEGQQAGPVVMPTNRVWISE